MFACLGKDFPLKDIQKTGEADCSQDSHGNHRVRCVPGATQHRP